MWSRPICAAVAAAVLATGGAQAQETPKGDEPMLVMTQKIREKLAAQGFQDVKVTPGSFVVSAKDKDGQRILMMISPTETKVMKMPDRYPSQAQTPGKGDDQIIQQ
jgi:hypothetical protein